MTTSSNPNQPTVGDLLTALERVEHWIRDIRGALKQLDVTQSVALPRMKVAGTPPMAQGSCPPPLPDILPPETA